VETEHALDVHKNMARNPCCIAVAVGLKINGLLRKIIQ